MFTGLTRLSFSLPLLGAFALGCGGCNGPADPADPTDAGSPDAGFPYAVTCSGETSLAAPVALPKNIIFIMGDGMGPAQIRAGQIAGGGPLGFESLGPPVYINTDSLTTDASDMPDDEPTDSAASATAIASGVRTLNDMVGEDPEGNELETVVDFAKAAGKAIGLVTTSMIYDASPAAFFAHVADRAEYDAIITELLTNAEVDLIFGGGRGQFEKPESGFVTMAATAGYGIVNDATELAAWDPSAQPKLLGLFQGNAISEVPLLWEWFTTPVTLRDAQSTDPTLPEMTARALDGLAGDPEGFFLFIENEHIDTLGHIALVEGELSRADMPLEVVELDAAVKVATDWIEANSSYQETLVVVSADHETGGYRLWGDDLAEADFPFSPVHTRQPVAVYAKGPGAENLASLCRVTDLHLLLTGRLPAQ